MYYGIAGPGVRMVTEKWKTVADLAAIVPYCSYRKFDTSQEAWNFINSRRQFKFDNYLRKYGDTFDSPYISLKYIIYGDTAYYTIKTEKFGNIRIDIPDLYIKYKANTILIKKDFDYLDNNSILDHIKVIGAGIALFGEFIDIDVVVPDNSIFYACFSYNGESEVIRKYREVIDNRMARISYSMEVKDGQHKRDVSSYAPSWTHPRREVERQPRRRRSI